MSIEDLVPKTRTSIANVGFLFGAGTSYESGYPLVSGLTQDVVSSLPEEMRAVLDEVLGAFGTHYSASTGRPNIEEISDMVIEHHVNSQLPKFLALREKVRERVREAILSVASPDISYHADFLHRIQKRAFDRPTDVWIFTTNYDLLFENACAEVGIRLVNGFNGATTRYFAEDEFTLMHGNTSEGRFTPQNGLTVRLVKLHGSVSWFQRGGRFFEASPREIQEAEARCMVLPRRTKVVETLSRPYDRLFRLCSTVLGERCRHLISAGFSFSDSHINDTLVLPKVNSGAIALYNFCQDEPSGLSTVRERPNVWHFGRSMTVNGGRSIEAARDTWKFSEFVTLF